MTRGQLFSTDFFVGVVILAFLLGASTYVWTSNMNRAGEKIQVQELEYRSYVLSSAMVKSPGVPEYWEANTSLTRAIGLASSDRVVSEAKFNALISMDYDEARKRFGVEGYGLYVALLDGDQNLLNEYGFKPSKQVSISSRIPVTYKGNASYLDVVLWSNPEEGMLR